MLRRVQAREVLREGEGWRIHAEGAGPIAAHSIVDASGRQSRIARRLGAERRVADRLAALVCHVALPAEPIAATTLVESVAAGWWYSAPLPGNQAVVALMTDADLLRGLAVGDAADFLARLAATRHVGSRLAGARLVDGPHSCTARSQQLDPPLGPGWVAAGDAACAFDPLASLGIGHALGSGIQAARIAHQRLGGDDSLARAYAGDIARHFAMHAAQSRSIYAAERRWPEAPFWRRRH